jgi:hypothetical protein
MNSNNRIVRNPEASAYLEKVAGKYLDRALSFADDVWGGTARGLAHEGEVLAKAEAQGRTAKSVLTEASEAHKRMKAARVKTGIGVAGAGTAGFLGIHKYHQHKDNAILAKIDSMYADRDKQNNQ